jgi:LysM repeat protein
MWFGRNQKRIKLSRQLKWSVGKAQHTGNYLWAVGGLCLVVAVGFLVHTNRILRTDAQPTVLGASTTVLPEATPAIEFESYEVARGDTLFTISQHYDVPTETLAQLNDIKPPFTLKAGETIKIPVR